MQFHSKKTPACSRAEHQMHLEELRMRLIREQAQGRSGEALLGELESVVEEGRRWPAWRKS